MTLDDVDAAIREWKEANAEYCRALNYLAGITNRIVTGYEHGTNT